MTDELTAHADWRVEWDGEDLEPLIEISYQGKSDGAYRRRGLIQAKTGADITALEGVVTNHGTSLDAAHTRLHDLEARTDDVEASVIRAHRAIDPNPGPVMPQRPPVLSGGNGVAANE